MLTFFWGLYKLATRKFLSSMLKLRFKSQHFLTHQTNFHQSSKSSATHIYNLNTFHSRFCQWEIFILNSMPATMSDTSADERKPLNQKKGMETEFLSGIFWHTKSENESGKSWLSGCEKLFEAWKETFYRS